MQPKTLPYGTWSSPISASQLATSSMRLGDLRVAGGHIYWSEARPREKGNVRVMRADAYGRYREVTGRDVSVRTRVHEYGGAPYAVARPRIVYSNDKTGALWVKERKHRRPIAEEVGARYADMRFATGRNDSLFCIRETHPTPAAEANAPNPSDSQTAADTPVAELAAPEEQAPDSGEGEVQAASGELGDTSASDDANEEDAQAPATPASEGETPSATAEESASSGEHTEPRNELVHLLLSDEDCAITVVATGHDFYGSPLYVEGEQRLYWLAWNHPHMPWQQTELWAADGPPEGPFSEPRKVYGQADESIADLQLGPQGELLFVSDRSGFWNLYRLGRRGAEALLPMEAEFARPAWAFGQHNYCVLDDERLICSVAKQGRGELAIVNLRTGGYFPLALPYAEFSQVIAFAEGVAFIAAGPSEPTQLVYLNLRTQELKVIRKSQNLDLAPEWISEPQDLVYPTGDGAMAYGFYYPPKNPNAQAPAGELPPLLVLSHGGPTSRSAGVFQLSIQYWTSRGFGVLDVNYRGSSGYGREYRVALDGQWGVRDVEDCARGAMALVERAEVDAARLAIRGGSAGGYTTLCALCFARVFKAGASHYGVADLRALASDTHKFESRYLDSLIGPLPEADELYDSRSPVNHTDNFSCPILFLQGLEDKVVPPSQAEAMMEALKEKDIPVAYLPFEGEQHGFRRAENIRKALETELAFYGHVFGFRPAGRLPKVPFVNAPPAAPSAPPKAPPSAAPSDESELDEAPLSRRPSELQELLPPPPEGGSAESEGLLSAPDAADAEVGQAPEDWSSKHEQASESGGPDSQPPSSRGARSSSYPPPSSRDGRRSSYPPPSSRDSYPPSSRDSYPPSSRNSYPPSSRDSYPPSSRNSYPPSSRDSYPPPRSRDERDVRSSYPPARPRSQERPEKREGTSERQPRRRRGRRSGSGQQGGGGQRRGRTGNRGGGGSKSGDGQNNKRHRRNRNRRGTARRKSGGGDS